jgi:hypothetical protein
LSGSGTKQLAPSLGVATPPPRRRSSARLSCLRRRLSLANSIADLAQKSNCVDNDAQAATFGITQPDNLSKIETGLRPSLDLKVLLENKWNDVSDECNVGSRHEADSRDDLLISEATLADSIMGKGVIAKLNRLWHSRLVIELKETKIQLKEEKK